MRQYCKDCIYYDNDGYCRRHEKSTTPYSWCKRWIKQMLGWKE